MVALQYLSCVCNIIACLTDVPFIDDAAEVIDQLASIAWCSVCACMQTQVRYEMNKNTRFIGQGPAKLHTVRLSPPRGDVPDASRIFQQRCSCRTPPRAWFHQITIQTPWSRAGGTTAAADGAPWRPGAVTHCAAGGAADAAPGCVPGHWCPAWLPRGRRRTRAPSRVPPCVRRRPQELGDLCARGGLRSDAVASRDPQPRPAWALAVAVRPGLVHRPAKKQAAVSRTPAFCAGFWAELKAPVQGAPPA